MSKIDDRDTRFVWVDDLQQMSHNIKQSEISDRDGTYIHMYIPGCNGKWIRMDKEQTVSVKA